MIGINSCVMWCIDLRLDASLGAIFKEEDLSGAGVEYDSHITIAYAKDQVLDPEDDVFQESIKKLREFVDSIKDKEEHTVPILSLFELDKFENDSDYIILRLKRDNIYYRLLKKAHDKLVEGYDIELDYLDYTPHVTLAELNPGEADKYLNNKLLWNLLEGGAVHFEDLCMSSGRKGIRDFKQKFITKFNLVDRFFRIRDLERESSI